MSKYTYKLAKLTRTGTYGDNGDILQETKCLDKVYVRDDLTDVLKVCKRCLSRHFKRERECHPELCPECFTTMRDVKEIIDKGGCLFVYVRGCTIPSYVFRPCM